MDFVDKISDNLRHCLNEAKNIAQNQNRSLVTINDFIIALFKEPGTLAHEILTQDKPDITKAIDDLKQLNIPPVETASDIKSIEDLLMAAFNLAFEQKHTFVGTEHCLAVLIKDPPYLVNYIIKKHQLNIEKIQGQLENLLRGDSKIPELTNLHSPLNTNPEFDFSSDSSEALNFFAQELTDVEYQKNVNPIIKRETELNRLIQILCRKDKNNPLILGDPGVGKTALVEGLAKKITQGQVPNILKNKKIVSLDLGAMIAGTMYRGDFENRLKNVVDEIKNDPNIILFIDELHNIVGAGSNNGNMDAGNLLKPLLARGQLRCIGATTMEEYKKFIEKDAALERRFQTIILREPSLKETNDILNGVKSNYETYHQVIFADSAIKAALHLSQRYIQDKLMPDKAIDLLDEAAAKQKIKTYNNKKFTALNELQQQIDQIIIKKEQAVRTEKYQEALKLKKQESLLQNKINKLHQTIDQGLKKNPPTVEEKTIYEIIAEKTQIPLDELHGNDWKILNKIHQQLATEIIGQDEALQEIINLLKKSKLGIQDENRPLASFLFVGPSGVGKTFTAKILAEKLYRDTDSFVRIDMSEFSEKFNASKLVGAPAGYVGYREENKLTDAIKKRPHSLILFDEIDKAHPDIINLLLQLLEDGQLTDATGKKINFKNTVIIMTTNSGSEWLSKNITLGFGNTQNPSDLKNKIIDELKKTFRPEFINRIDRTIFFQALTQQHLKKIIQQQLKKIQQRKPDFDLSYFTKNISELAHKSQTVGNGARGVRQIIDQEIDRLIMTSSNKK